MPAPLQSALHELGKPRINRAPSPILAVATPWLLVMLGSLSPTWPIISSAPVMPPLGFLLLVAWQQLRPGLFPVWAGLPLGLFDDLFSGQPLGSAVVLYSAAMLALDLIEHRFPWRGFALNWLVACPFITAYLVLAQQLANLGGGATELAAMLPQLVLSLLAYPLAASLVGLADRFRLIPIRAL
ncbi:rod shape-determining protein MreD [Novosphingobium sp.]|uniref:rod shape-determining protein MreD n=1 Tax=Novosphingobium sp. TaxID=1874826 RepID=UPI0025CDE264|nr:rod shape-determining protein MreD [Novosphingobium sp.]MCC6925662.1 rod shape-determining protein MreD [Novosphingobium sp.]